MTHLKSVRIGELVAGEQPSASDLLGLRKQGFRSVVNLRLAHETSQGLTPEQEGGLASVVELAFVHLPISVDELSEKDVRAFEDAVADLPSPVYVHCGLGQRAATLALLADAEQTAPAAETIAEAERHGIAITPRVRAFIDQYLDRREDDRESDKAIFARVVR